MGLAPRRSEETNVVSNQNAPLKSTNETNYKKLSTSDGYPTRKARSLEMLKQGVEPVKNSFNEYLIPSQTDKTRKYKVAIKNGWYTCECPDNSQHKNLCKHILFLKTWFAIRLQAKEIKQVAITTLCPYCESNELIKDGTRKTTMGKKQKWLCNTCNGRFVAEPIKKSKGNTDTVTLSMDLYFKGCSYRDIQDTLRQSYGLKIHHETVRRWINKYMAQITQYTEQLQPQVSGVWHADEQKCQIKKEIKTKEDKKEKWWWNWNVMDSETRFLLANQITKEREIVDARKVLRQAKAIANKKAIKIITDGLQGYRTAVRKEFGTYSNPNPHVRLRTIREKPNNNLIERYHGTFRERDKVMRAFQNETTMQQHNDRFRTHYNFLRPHKGLNGLTPAQRAGLEEPSDFKPLLLKALSAETRQPKSDSQ